MIEIGINKLKKSYGANLIFEDVSFELQSNEIIGLIGQNGVGKTTLMKILMGQETAEGDIFLRKGIKLSYLNQIPVYDKNDQVIDILYQALSDIQTVKNRMTELEHEMANTEGEKLQLVMEKYSQCQTEFEMIGGYAVEENLGKIVTGLELDGLIELPFDSLSGGEKTRVMLGKVLLEKPGVLLLDEPTNHLDIKMISWLENYLNRYEGAVILISHDRYFLDKVVNKIVELHSNGAEIYLGNYSYYKVEKEVRYEQLMKEYESQQKKIKTLKEQIKRYRIWGEMRDSDKMYRRAKELEKRLDKIDELDRPSKDKNIKLQFEKLDRTGKRVYELQDVYKSYDDKTLLEDVNLEVIYQDCLSIIGENGTGKTTLLKMMREEITPDKGTIRIGSRLNIGYLPQEIKFSSEDLSILDTYQQFFNCTVGEARSALARVLFSKDDVFKKIKILSGGEKVRLKLVMLMDQKVNVLMLDEPTNHLDIDSREILEHSLQRFGGTIIVISHDRYFINQLSNRIALIENNHLKVYEGDFDYFLNERQKELDKEKENEKEKQVNKNISKQKKTVSESKETTESILSKIEEKEKELNDLIKLMNLNYRDVESIKVWKKLEENLEKELHILYKDLESSI